MNEQHPSKWRNPVMWLVAGLPALSIVAGVGLVVVANLDSNDAVPDRVRRTAQIQVADLGPDAIAQREGLTAIVRSEAGVLEVLPVSGAFDRAKPLRVALLHPSKAAGDRTIVLAPSELGWRAEATVDPTHDWNLRLEADDGRWRLLGRLPKGQHAAHLRPALQGGG